jgi:hypothetical protein
MIICTLSNRANGNDRIKDFGKDHLAPSKYAMVECYDPFPSIWQDRSQLTTRRNGPGILRDLDTKLYDVFWQKR